MNNVEDFEMEDLYSLDESEEFDGTQASASASDTPEATPADAAANGAIEDGVTASATASGMSGNERAIFLQLMENQQQLQEMLMATVQNQSRPGKTRRVYVPCQRPSMVKWVTTLRTGWRVSKFGSTTARTQKISR